METLFLALRVSASLAAVAVAIWLARRWLSGGRSRRRQIAVLAQRALGGRAKIAVVETDGRRYLLGVTDHAVTVLDRLETEPAEVSTTPIPLPAPAGGLSEGPSRVAIPREPIALPVTRRAVREAARAKPSPAAPSILSPDAWRQTAIALRRAR